MAKPATASRVDGSVQKKAWAATPNFKIFQALEMRKDCAAEALETEG